MSITSPSESQSNIKGPGLTPLYRRLYGELKARIAGGIYRPGTALPSESRMRDEFGVSLITIRRAIHELALDGLVDSRQGIGSFVCDPTQRSLIVGMSSFTSDVVSGRLRLVRTLMSDDLVSAPADAAARLGVQAGSMLRHLIRLDYEGGQPFSVDEAYVPPALGSEVTREIASSPAFMHLWQEASGIRLVKTQCDTWVEVPQERYQEVLKIGSDTPLLVTGELVYDSKDRPALWIVTRYRGDRCRLTGMVMLVQKKTGRGIVGE